MHYIRKTNRHAFNDQIDNEANEQKNDAKKSNGNPKERLVHKNRIIYSSFTN